MAKYTGSWSVSGGASYGGDYEFDSLRDARKTMRSIARGNCPEGDHGYWHVEDADGNEVATGRV